MLVEWILSRRPAAEEQKYLKLKQCARSIPTAAVVPYTANYSVLAVAAATVYPVTTSIGAILMCSLRSHTCRRDCTSCSWSLAVGGRRTRPPLSCSTFAAAVAESDRGGSAAQSPEEAAAAGAHGDGGVGCERGQQSTPTTAAQNTSVQYNVRVERTSAGSRHWVPYARVTVKGLGPRAAISETRNGTNPAASNPSHRDSRMSPSSSSQKDQQRASPDRSSVPANKACTFPAPSGGPQTTPRLELTTLPHTLSAPQTSPPPKARRLTML